MKFHNRIFNSILALSRLQYQDFHLFIPSTPVIFFIKRIFKFLPLRDAFLFCIFREKFPSPVLNKIHKTILSEHDF
jgi:hypothetical protein